MEEYINTGAQETTGTSKESLEMIKCYRDDDGNIKCSVKQHRRHCRLCAKSTGEMTYIFETNGSQKSLAHKINSCLPVKVKRTDPLPKQLCSSCVENLNIAYEFSENCILAEGKLQTSANANMFRVKPVQSKIGGKKREQQTLNELENRNTLELNNIPMEEDCKDDKEDTSITLPNTGDNLSNNNSVLCTSKHIHSNIDSQSQNTAHNQTTFEPHNNETTYDQTQAQSIDLTDKTDPNNFNTSENNYESENELSCPLCIKGRMKITNNSEETCHENEKNEISNTLNKQDNVQIEHRPECLEEIPQSAFKSTGSKKKDVEFLNCGPKSLKNERDLTIQFLPDSSVICQICGSLFLNAQQCIKHAENHATNDYFPCSICTLSFTSRESWLNHCDMHASTVSLEESDPLEAPIQIINAEGYSDQLSAPRHIYRCDICVKFFPSDITLQYHHNNFHSGSPICCEICNKDCETPIEYFDHMKKYHARNENSPSTEYDRSEIHAVVMSANVVFQTCKQCGLHFPSYELLQQHFKTHLEIKTIKCGLCGILSESEEFHKMHEIFAHSDTLPSQVCIQCKICKEIFSQVNQAMCHVIHHRENPKETKGFHEISVTSVYQCEYCAKCFSGKPELKAHYKEHTGKKIYACKTCKTLFYNSNQLTKHQWVHNEFSILDAETEITVPKLYVCFECDQCFLNWDTICQHFRKHDDIHKFYTPHQIMTICSEGNMRIECDMKPLTDKTNIYNNDQQLTHVIPYETACHTPNSKHPRKGKAYACTVCGEIFRLKSMFEKHFRKHTDERPYFCETCGRTFTHKSGLYTHRRMHTGERPYACDMCDRSFRLKHDRDNHRRCHTGERPFKCSVCEKAFRTSHDHRQHMLIHTGQRPYLCTICGKGFRRINGLNVHKRVHTGEKPYGCDSCGRHFTQKGDMMKHRRTQHGNVKKVIDCSLKD